MTDPIADMLTRLRNAVIAKHARVDVPASKLKVEIAKILEDEGYIQGFKMVDEKSPEAAKAAAPRQVIRICPEVRTERREGDHAASSASAARAAACTSGAPRCRRCWAGSARAS